MLEVDPLKQEIKSKKTGNDTDQMLGGLS